MSLVGANGRPVSAKAETPVQQTIQVSWAFIVGIGLKGETYLLDHGSVHTVRARRGATLDDMYGALEEIAISGSDEALELHEDIEYGDELVAAFLVFSIDGNVALSPNVFEDVAPMSWPYPVQVRQAARAAQAQIIGKHAARMAAPVAAQASLATFGRASQAQTDAAQSAAVSRAVTKTRNG
jgi:hypothetical protein